MVRIAVCFLLLSHVTLSNGYQFYLDAKQKKCFKEDIPLSADARFTYTITQGDGEMPVTVRLLDMSGNVLFSKESADHGLFTFRSPDTIPGLSEKNSWALHDDEHDEDDDTYFRKLPEGAGDNRMPFVVCFQNPPASMFHLSVHATHPKRRILFSIKYGAESKTMQDYDKLAKEKHLSSTEELFRIVEDRVSEIVRMVDEMRERELRMNHLTVRTTNTVTWYSIFTCICIAIGAVYSSHATFNYLSRRKVT